jgi:hypothetical protein
MNKQQTIELLQKQIPSFYSLEQVINIIKDIEEDKVEAKVEFSDELIDSIVEEVGDLGNDLFDDYELEMYNNVVELSVVDINRDAIKRAVSSAIDNQ